MKVIIVLAAVVALASCAPYDPSKVATILRYENDNIGVEGYNFAFETSDGTSKVEQGELRSFGPESAAVVVRGSYNYIGDDGITYTVNYVADENGFKADGAHLPKDH